MTLDEVYEFIVDQELPIERDKRFNEQILFSYHLLNACGLCDAADFLYGQFCGNQKVVDEGYG